MPACAGMTKANLSKSVRWSTSLHPVHQHLPSCKEPTPVAFHQLIVIFTGDDHLRAALFGRRGHQQKAARLRFVSFYIGQDVRYIMTQVWRCCGELLYFSGELIQFSVRGKTANHAVKDAFWRKTVGP